MFLSFGGRIVSPKDFYYWTIPDTIRAVRALTGRGIAKDRIAIEIHNEPNLRTEGLGTSWDDGREFGAWIKELITGVPGQFPGLWAALPGVQLMFPGLSPGFSFDGIVEARIDDKDFFADAWAVAAPLIDQIGVHAYWNTQDGDLYTVEKAADVVRHYAAYGPPVTVTEASNNKPDDPDSKAAQYVAFWVILRRISNVTGVTYFIASSLDPAVFADEQWLPVGMARRVRSMIDL